MTEPPAWDWHDIWTFESLYLDVWWPM